ncbi:hypothetical protein EVAR_56694_1 [Eumeta japonica]|uniref:Uncharacterized protein n=1 Tax=Eumeta variegata TaxID=151549 RepID=A0A4C1Y0V7_EUMVA|nr:hypothetical protein EVAR_56694_1 [Eumeta japonica]
MATAQLNIGDLRKILGLPSETESELLVPTNTPIFDDAPFSALRVRRQSMEQLSLIQITPDKQKQNAQQKEKNDVVRAESEENPVESFFDLVSRCQSERMDDQRATLNSHKDKENKPKPKLNNKLQRSASSGTKHSSFPSLDMASDYVVARDLAPHYHTTASLVSKLMKNIKALMFAASLFDVRRPQLAHSFDSVSMSKASSVRPAGVCGRQLDTARLDPLPWLSVCASLDSNLLIIPQLGRYAIKRMLCPAREDVSCDKYILFVVLEKKTITGCKIEFESGLEVESRTGSGSESKTGPGLKLRTGLGWETNVGSGSELGRIGIKSQTG